MSKTRTEFFYGTTFNASRNECLRALIAAIHRTAKQKRLFTTDDVFAEVSATDYSEHDFRVTTGPSKLISVALNKVRNEGVIRPSTDTEWHSGPISHSRPKRVWISEKVVCA